MGLQLIAKVRVLLLILNVMLLVNSLAIDLYEDTTSSTKENNKGDTSFRTHAVDLIVPETESPSASLLSVSISPFLIKLTINDNNNETAILNDDLLLDITKDHLYQEYENYFRSQLDSIVLKVSPFPSPETSINDKQFVFRGFMHFKFPPLPEDSSTIDQLTHDAFQNDKKILYLESLWETMSSSEKFFMVDDAEVIMLGVVESNPTLPPLQLQPVPDETNLNNGHFIGLIIVFCVVVILSSVIVCSLFYAINTRSCSNDNVTMKAEEDAEDNISNKKAFAPSSSPAKTSETFPQVEMMSTSSYSSFGSSMSNSSHQKYVFSINDEEDSFNYYDNSPASFSITSNQNSHNAIDIASIQQMSDMSDGRFNAILNNDSDNDNDDDDNNDNDNSRQKEELDRKSIKNKDDNANTSTFQCSNSVWNDAELPSFELTEDGSVSFGSSMSNSSNQKCSFSVNDEEDSFDYYDDSPTSFSIASNHGANANSHKIAIDVASFKK